MSSTAVSSSIYDNTRDGAVKLIKHICLSLEDVLVWPVFYNNLLLYKYKKEGQNNEVIWISKYRIKSLILYLVVHFNSLIYSYAQ